MKKFILILALLCGIHTLFAQCEQNRISFFPKGEHITPYPIIMISGNQMTQKVINELGFLHEVYLESDRHKVALNIVEKCFGQADETQILLRPQQKLHIGKQYHLKVAGLEEEEKKLFERTDQTGNTFYISWNVSEEVVHQELAWTSPPRLMSIHFDQEENCAPSAFALFSVDIPQPHETLIKTEVIDTKTGKTSVYYLQSESNQLIVGKDNFGGAFDFTKNHRYKVRFDLLHINGLATGNWTYWTTFESPYNMKIDRIIDMYSVDGNKI